MDEPYEVVSNGEETALVELPISWILDNYPYNGENANGSNPSPDAVFQIHNVKFDLAYKEKALFILTNHPHISGHRSRVVELDKRITYTKSKSGVWFATLEQIQDTIKEAGHVDGTSSFAARYDF